ncbi:hypothetical protein QR98_0034060 [Sarcoptes scabiei]|uniref:Uncharacterized protein n=1 Tax=Sarcoptes scabiei TaxID=52283 RepID=A0A132A3J4_SARSC|nr:hypothetical protein QR98_0034060 [Sarcoptes scabiei]
MASIILSPKNDDYHHHHNLQQQQQRQHPQLNLSVENLDTEQRQQSKTDIVSVEIKNFDQTEFEIEENDLNENQNVMNRDDFSDSADQNILNRTHLDSLQNDVEISDDKPRDNVNDLSKECDDNFQIFVTENSVFNQKPSKKKKMLIKHIERIMVVVVVMVMMVKVIDAEVQSIRCLDDEGEIVEK